MTEQPQPEDTSASHPGDESGLEVVQLPGLGPWTSLAIWGLLLLVLWAFVLAIMASFRD